MTQAAVRILGLPTTIARRSAGSSTVSSPSCRRPPGPGPPDAAGGRARHPPLRSQAAALHASQPGRAGRLSARLDGEHARRPAGDLSSAEDARRLGYYAQPASLPPSATTVRGSVAIEAARTHARGAGRSRDRAARAKIAMILDSATVDADVTLDADVCVVGSGAGGAVAACSSPKPAARSWWSRTARISAARVRAARGGDVPAPLSRGRNQGDGRLHRTGVAGARGRRLDGRRASALCVRPPRRLARLLGATARTPRPRVRGMHPFFRRVEKRIGARHIFPSR